MQQDAGGFLKGEWYVTPFVSWQQAKKQVAVQSSRG